MDARPTLKLTTSDLYRSLPEVGQITVFDVGLRFASIEHKLKNGCFPELYRKNCQLRERDRVEAEKRLTTFADLISAYSTSSEKNVFPVKLNSGRKLLDGAHRLACSIFFGISSIPYEVVDEKLLGPIVSRDWFMMHFEARECETIFEAVRSIERRIH
jgi:hypothetical protein